METYPPLLATNGLNSKLSHYTHNGLLTSRLPFHDCSSLEILDKIIPAASAELALTAATTPQPYSKNDLLKREIPFSVSRLVVSASARLRTITSTNIDTQRLHEQSLATDAPLPFGVLMQSGMSDNLPSEGGDDVQFTGQRGYPESEMAEMSGSRTSLATTPTSTGPYVGVNDNVGYLTTTNPQPESDFGGPDETFGNPLTEADFEGAQLLDDFHGSSYGGAEPDVSESANNDRGQVGVGSPYRTQPASDLKTEDEEQEANLSWGDTRTKAGKERKRLPLACIMCRRKKIRCSGEKPACKHCVRSRIPCVYKQTTRKTTPRADYMAMLERRLKRMEDRILKSIPKEDVASLIATTGRSAVRPSMTSSSKKRGAESTTSEESAARESYGAPTGPFNKRHASDEPGSRFSPYHQQHEGSVDQSAAALAATYKEWFKNQPVNATGGALSSGYQHGGEYGSGFRTPSEVSGVEHGHHTERGNQQEFILGLSSQGGFTHRPVRAMSLPHKQQGIPRREEPQTPDAHHSPSILHHMQSPTIFNHLQSPAPTVTTASFHPSPALSAHPQSNYVSSPPRLDTQTAHALSQAHLHSSPYYTAAHTPFPSPMSTRSSFLPQNYQSGPAQPSQSQPYPSLQGNLQYPSAQPLELCDWHRNLPSSATSANSKCVVCAFIISGMLNRAPTF